MSCCMVSEHRVVLHRAISDCIAFLSGHLFPNILIFQQPIYHHPLLSAWAPIHGHQCMDTNARTPMHGHQCMASMHGRQCMRSNYMGTDACTPMPGRRCMCPDTWAPMHGHQYITQCTLYPASTYHLHHKSPRTQPLPRPDSPPLIPF